MKEIIADIIDEWEPVDLFAVAPQDKYKEEIVRRLDLLYHFPWNFALNVFPVHSLLF